MLDKWKISKGYSIKYKDMSVRRGRVSEVEDAVSRREWYLKLEEKVFDPKTNTTLRPINSQHRAIGGR